MAADGSTIWRRADEDNGGGLPHVHAKPANVVGRKTTLKDMTGERWGAWVVLCRAPVIPQHEARWTCRCDCGTVRDVSGHYLRTGSAAKSCGCIKRPRPPRVPKEGGHKRNGVTLSTMRWAKRDIERGRAEYPAAEHARYPRPVMRGDCLSGGINAQRPCPWASCRHHLALDVLPNGNVRLRDPSVDVSDMTETCSLDVADRGGETLEVVGAALSVTRERIRQIELAASQVLAASRLVRRIAGVE